MVSTAFKVLGVILVLVGVLGFISNPIVGPSGIFVTNTLHDAVHIITGVVLLAVGFVAMGAASMTAIVLGVVYLLVALLGFLVAKDGSILGLIDTNGADHILHLALAVVFFFLGLKGKKSSSIVQPMNQPMM